MTVEIILTDKEKRSSSEKHPLRKKILVHPMKEEDDDDEDHRPKTCSPTYAKIIKNITVEPTILLHMVTILIVNETSQNLGSQKACRVSLNFTEEVCRSLKLQTMNIDNKYEIIMQEFLATLLLRKTYISTAIQCLIVLIAGSYTDITGRRKLFTLIPIVGQILICISNMINVYYFKELSVEFLVYSETLLEAFSGGWCLMSFACYSYISFVTAEDKRTFRMGMINVALSIGLLIGTGLRDYIIKNYGYFGGYGVAFAIGSINMMYNIIWLKEPERGFEQRKVRLIIVD